MLPTVQNQAWDPNWPGKMQSRGFCWTFEKQTLSAGVARLVGSRAAEAHPGYHTGRLSENKAKAEPSHTLRLIFNDIVRSLGSSDIGL